MCEDVDVDVVAEPISTSSGAMYVKADAASPQVSIKTVQHTEYSRLLSIQGYH